MEGCVIEEEKKKPKKKKKAVEKAPAQEAASNVEEVFLTFTANSAGEMDGKTFAKFAKDCKVLNKKCTTTDIDLIFAKVK